MRAASLLLSLLMLSACGGRSPADLQQTIGYVHQYTSQGQRVPTLAEQSRRNMQVNTPFTYVYSAPTQEDEAPTSAAANTDDDSVDTDVLSDEMSEEESFEEEFEDDNDADELDSDAFGDSVAETASEITTPALPRAQAFTLENLDGETQQFSFPRSKPLILAIADQKGSEQMEAWIQPLYDRYESQVDIHGVAELSAVPKFARGMARGIISRLVKQPIMLDWTGNVSASFEATADVTNIYVISTEGEILARSSDVANLDKLKTIAAAMDAHVN